MKYFAAIQFILDASKGEPHRQDHFDFLQRGVADGHIFAWGKFIDGAYGLTVFQADTLEEAQRLAESDPYVIHGVRRVEVHEWALKIRQ